MASAVMLGANPRRMAAGIAVAAAGMAFWLSTTGFSAVRSAEAQRCRHLSGTAIIPAGETPIGEDGPHTPGRLMAVAAFRIDRTEVTNRLFAAFVAATGYVTDAERQGKAAVFVPPAKLDRGLDDASQWWRMVKGASWRHPNGPDSSIAGRQEEPVVQVTFNDAMAYARWRGGSLPTELQWERAARARQVGPRDPQSWAKHDDGTSSANTWQGIFPIVNSGKDGFPAVAPVGCFKANGFSLYDMVGNVWEWTRTSAGRPGPLRGGSYLCSTNYCANYRPAGRQVQEHDLATSHAGFRLVYPAGAGRVPVVGFVHARTRGDRS